ncbi:hypothetical protein G9A89_018995 [Geosiphon pyriformis]|nr:hypothetical protein G9A89_018995 [Geosiphon pyriformis]
MENLEIKRTRPEAHDCSLCYACQESIQNNRYNYCRACWFIFIEKLYKNFSSGNKAVDEIIKNPIYIPPNNNETDPYYKNGRVVYYSWVRWEDLKNISKIGEGGFGTIFKATYIDGFIDKRSIKHHDKMECKKRGKAEVAIKFINTSLQNSEELFKELNIQRTIFINNGEYLANISSIRGITQNAETLEYGIVMMFAKHGDMRNYLSKNLYSINWEKKLMIAGHIANGLISIHSAGMVHRDLHPGNMLQFEKDLVYIGDLGLSQPTTETLKNEMTTTTEEKKGIYGVIPYIPPEVLRGEEFTMAGDIYSFAMLLWELATGKPPFYERLHDNTLIFNIVFKGIRPNIISPLIPPRIAELIEKCWDANPLNRPTAKEVKKNLWELIDLYRNDEGPERLQFEESEKYIKDDDEAIKTSTMPINLKGIYTSRLLTSQINEKSKELIYLPELLEDLHFEDSL